MNHVWSAKKKNSIIFLSLLVVSLIAFGAYFFLRENSSQSSENNSVETKFKKEFLAELGLTEPELNSLISQTSYQGDWNGKLPSSFEEIFARDRLIISKKIVNVFSSLPSTAEEFWSKCQEIEKEKDLFVLLSSIPRQTNGSVDWKKFQEIDSKSTSAVDEMRKYIDEKINPALQDWYNSLANYPDYSVQDRVSQLNQQINEYTDINFYAKTLIDKLKKVTGGDFNEFNEDMEVDLGEGWKTKLIVKYNSQ